MAEGGAAPMTDAHRQLLQALMARGLVEAGRARRLQRLAYAAHAVPTGQEEPLDAFLGTVNAHLRPLSMEIRKGLAEEDGRPHYALVNLAENEIAKMASDYAEHELELFKKTMNLILSSENGFASSTVVLNLADQVKPRKMKKVEAEQLLQSLVQSKWLQEKEGEYTLSVRSILELEQYIFHHYPDLAHKCHFCHSLCIQRQVCEDCGTVMHLHCVARYFRSQAEPRCPHCRQFWPHQLPAQS